MILESVYIFICQFQIRPTKNSVIFLIMNVAFLLFNVYNLFVIPIKSLNNCANSIWLETLAGYTKRTARKSQVNRCYLVKEMESYRNLKD